jgi:mycothiol synthase
VTEFSWSDRPDPVALRALLAAVSAVDGRPALPAGAGVPGEFHGGEVLLASTGGDAAGGDPAGGHLVGCVHLNAEGDAFGRLVAELVVRPADRRQGIGGRLVRGLLERAGIAEDAEPGDSLRVWAHGDQPAAAALARRFGFQRVRELRRLRMPLADRLPAVRLPDGVRLRAFRPGADEDAVVEVNRLAFAWHPEQGTLTADDVRAAEREPWFDAAGFLLAVDADDTVLGFHWTKVHPAVGGEPMGEVYVVGVHPNAQGGGLGKALTLAGLEYLRDVRSVRNVMLYVESDNVPALAVYEKLGFTFWDADVQYAR